MMNSADKRDLMPEERGVLQKVLAAQLFPGAEQLLAQVPRTTVIGGDPTSLELDVADAEPADSPDGPVPVRAFVGSADDFEGEIIVWVERGYLAGLEFAWVTDRPPRGLPQPERVHVQR